jgi:hypothetical protein
LGKFRYDEPVPKPIGNALNGPAWPGNGFGTASDLKMKKNEKKACVSEITVGQ